MENTQTPKFEAWAIVELFGHSQIAGRCTEQNIAGATMLRVDVPETDAQPAFTRFLSAGAIYAINPVDATIAKERARIIEVKPVDAYSIDKLINKRQAEISATMSQFHDAIPVEIPQIGEQTPPPPQDESPFTKELDFSNMDNWPF